MTFNAEFRVQGYDEIPYAYIDLGWLSGGDHARDIRDWRNIRSRQRLQEVIENLQQVAQEWDEWERVNVIRKSNGY